MLTPCVKYLTGLILESFYDKSFNFFIVPIIHMMLISFFSEMSDPQILAKMIQCYSLWYVMIIDPGLNSTLRWRLKKAFLFIYLLTWF